MKKTQLPAQYPLEKERRWQYLTIILTLLGACYFFGTQSFLSNKDNYHMFALLNASIALIVGIIGLIRYYTRKDGLVLILGVGFVGTAFLESHHFLLTSDLFSYIDIYKPRGLIIWSYTATRVFLSLLIFTSWLAWKYQATFNKKLTAYEGRIIAIIIGVLISTLFMFSYFPGESASIFPILFLIFKIISGLLFLMALIGFYISGFWKAKHWRHFLILFLIISVFGESLCMVLSRQIYDVYYVGAYNFKLISYMLMLWGFLKSVFYNYSLLENKDLELKDKMWILEKTNNALKYLYKDIEVKNKDLEDARWSLEKTNESIKLLYKELENKNKELMKLDNLKSDFVSTVSHELRTPLAISTEGISLVLDGLCGEISEKQAHFLNASKENLIRLGAIINDLLDISKIESGKIDLRPGFVNFSLLIKTLVDNYRTVTNTRKQNLILNLPENDIYLNIDGNKMIQVITNLINNAHKFTPEGGTITIQVEPQEENILIQVKDTGIGIAKEYLPKMFEKFQQFDRVDSAGAKGTGLGLAICKSLVELHHGKIWVDSVLDQGTTFSLLLPSYDQLRLEFDQKMDTRIQELSKQEKPAALLIVQMANFEEMSSQYGLAIVHGFLNIFQDVVQDVILKKEDKTIIYEDNKILVYLDETNRVGALTVRQKIYDALTKKNLRYKSKEIPYLIKIGSAALGRDLKTWKDLKEKAEKSFSKL